MTRFLLNNKIITSSVSSGTVLLDVIRFEQNLKGTKIGCREGDCGACTVLVGELIGREVQYRSVTSCLLATASVAGKHVVTIEGINMKGLNPIQQAMADEGATQCGFCTPGFIMSFAGFVLARSKPTADNARIAIDGNICRCTGYKSIERAAHRIAEVMQSRGGEDPLLFASKNLILPDYFAEVRQILESMRADQAPALLSFNQLSHRREELPAPRILAGGTDLYVQQHEEMQDAEATDLNLQNTRSDIRSIGDMIHIGPAATVATFFDAQVIRELFPDYKNYRRLVSSTPIRNMATVGGNFINASPIGDLTIFFLALNASLELTDANTGNKRNIPLRIFYKGYKQLDKLPTEYLTDILFLRPAKDSLFHFDKVSKRMHLDIASVNTSILINMQGKVIVNASLAAGGVSAIPLFLKNASEVLSGKTVSIDLVREVIKVMQQEISPISDARGSADYKRLLLSQLIKAHFIKLFPSVEPQSILKA